MIIVAGPSGAGKSVLAERLGLPVLALDDFYRDGRDPDLPRVAAGATAGQPDWDDPRSWLADEAVEAIESLCRTGVAEVPIYRLAEDGRCGMRTMDLDGSRFFLAEGIFAQELVPRLLDLGLLAAAYCVHQNRTRTFARRLARDLREGRKPPGVLVVRGLALYRSQPDVVDRAIECGCRPVTPEQAYRMIRELVAPAGRRPVLGGRLTQPDERSCGAAVVVVARLLREQEYADPPEAIAAARFNHDVLRTHRELTAVRNGAGRWQFPWPRRLGTPPWAIAHQLSDDTVRYRIRPIWPWRRAAAWARLTRALGSRRAVPLYVGNRWLPRHVVLAVGGGPDGVEYYEPGWGELVEVPRDDFVSGTLRLGWPLPWLALLPTPPPSRR